MHVTLERYEAFRCSGKGKACKLVRGIIPLSSRILGGPIPYKVQVARVSKTCFPQPQKFTDIGYAAISMITRHTVAYCTVQSCPGGCEMPPARFGSVRFFICVVLQNAFVILFLVGVVTILTTKAKTATTTSLL